MKKEIFKVCALGLVSVILITGCQTKEGNVRKITKNEEISYEEKVNVNDNNYYGIEIYQFTNSSQLKADYELEKKLFLQREEVVNVNTLTKEDNIYEAIVTIDSDSYAQKKYEYILYIKNFTDYVTLYQTSANSNKDEVIKIGNELKEKFKNSKDYLNTFNTIAKEKDLNIDKAYGCNGEVVSCKTALLATNIKQKDYKETTDKVETVESKFYELSNNSGKLIVEAKTADGKVVWSIDRGTIPVGIGFEGTVDNQVGDLYIESSYNNIIARNIQTSEVVWKSSIHSAIVHNMALANDKIFDIQGDIMDSLEVIDYKTGKVLYYKDNISQYIVRNANEEYDYYTINGGSAKVENDYIVYDVIDQDKDNVKVGKLRINTNTYKIEFVR